MENNIKVQRVFGRVSNEEVLNSFVSWFSDNLPKLEPVIDENNPKNGQMLLDWQEKTSSYVIEVQTTNSEFAEEILKKYEELKFDDFKNIGIVQ